MKFKKYIFVKHFATLSDRKVIESATEFCETQGFLFMQDEHLTIP